MTPNDVPSWSFLWSVSNNNNACLLFTLDWNGHGEHESYICSSVSTSRHKVTTRRIQMALTLLTCLLSIHLLLLSTEIPVVLADTTVSQSSLSIHGQSSSPSAAIVRRLYYVPGQSTSAITTRNNPYRSLVHQSHSRMPLAAKGIAKVTPISLQSPSFDPTIRLSNRESLMQTVLTASGNNQSLLQKTSTALIKVIEIEGLNDTTPSPSILITNTNASVNVSGIPPQSSRQGKSIELSLSVPTSTEYPSSTASLSSEPSKLASHQADNLCFLSHGGSSETFTVNEAMPVNSVIGTIKVIGDATDNGDIELSIIGHNDSNNYNGESILNKKTTNSSIESLDSINSTQSQDSITIPIRIEPGTKNLVLVRKLDKESVEGESSVTIAVRCRPKRLAKKKLARKLIKDLNDEHEDHHSNRVEKRITSAESNDQAPSYWVYETSSESSDLGPDDDIIIPIRILVTDANDNKPEWQGVIPYFVNISEMSAIGSVVLTGVRAVDNDQLGPYSTVEYYIEPGPYAHLLRFISPLEGTLVLSGQLDYETLPKFWVSIRAQDQGNPPNMAITKVNVEVIDADDQNPRFEVDKYTAVLGEGQIIAHALQVKPKPIKAEDPDLGIQSPIIYEFYSKDEDSRENYYFKIDAQNGQVSLRRPLHSSISLPITLVIRATQLDNQDRYALTTLTIVSKRNQVMPQLRFLHSNYSTSLLESTLPGQVVLTVQTSQPSNVANQLPLRFQILDDEEGYFAIKKSGEVIVNRMLDYEKHHRYTFRVMVTDGRQTDLTRLTVDIINVNEHDPVFSQSAYVFHVNEARLRSSPVIGQMQATDADDGDRIQLSLSGPHAGGFALSTDGTLRLRSLRSVNTTECHMIATATDSGTPPRSSSASVVVKFAPALLKSLTGRTLESLLFELEQENVPSDLSSVPAISPTAVDILQHSAANIFSASTNSTALVLVIVLGVLLGTLFIIIVALTLHVLKNRKYESRQSSNCSPVTLHQRHHASASSSSSSTSSSSSSSDLSLSGSGVQSHHHHHWAVQDDCKAANSERLLLAPTAIGPSMIRSNKVVPLESDRLSQNNEYNEEIDVTAKKLLANQKRTGVSVGPTVVASSTEQPDSAISSDLSCWSESNKTTSQIQSQQQASTINTRSNFDFNSGSDCNNWDLAVKENNTRNIINNNSSNNTMTPTNGGTVASRISVIRWPQGSIPRRVKKLTWKDEQRNNHLDQLYTGNSIVQASSQTSAKTKTKTLSGHLLTGNMFSTGLVTSTSPPSMNTNVSAKVDTLTGEDVSKCCSGNGHGHYHLHHTSKVALESPRNIIRHHQTPHYPVVESLMGKSSQLINQTNSQNKNYNYNKLQADNHQMTLPDLTVYF